MPSDHENISVNSNFSKKNILTVKCREIKNQIKLKGLNKVKYNEV